MYCNKVKKGKDCITYTLQLNLTKLNLDHGLSVRIFQSLVVKTLPCSGYFTACMNVQFPIVKLEYTDSTEFQFMSLCGIEVLACSFDTDFNYSLF